MSIELDNRLYKEIGKELGLGELISIEVIQSLWSGYGELVRLKFLSKTIIVKHVKLPSNVSHPRGWNTNFSHQRKLHSYQVEVNWYQEFSKEKDDRSPLPKGLKCFQSKDEWLIVMEDLAEFGFTHTTMDADKIHLSSCLKWLANFHAKYMGKRSDLLWELGTYWHVDTRPDELEVLKDTRLKSFAKVIDHELNSAKYQTIVHGDAKLANFCFNTIGDKCAAVDFQYVGHGCGMKDLVYFISSSVNPKDCESMQKWILDSYFDALKEALEYYHPKINILEVEKEWRGLYSIAWADFQRFIKGWNPEHYKINPYTKKLTKEALDFLESKSNKI